MEKHRYENILNQFEGMRIRIKDVDSAVFWVWVTVIVTQIGAIIVQLGLHQGTTCP
jgi:hypothetical protein